MGIYEVSVDGSFAARHAVALTGGGWEQPHEHRWEVRAVFRSRRLQEPMGVVVDFLAVKEAMDELAGELAGSDLNELPEFAGRGASAERLAKALAERLARRLGGEARLHRLSVTEAVGCRAAYYPHDDCAAPA